MWTDLLMMCVGAMLVAFGVVSGALADRIRGNARARRELSPVRRVAVPAPAEPAVAPPEHRTTRRERPSRLSPDVVPVPMLADVTEALVGLGYKASVASAAAGEARRRIGDGAPLELWLREALKHCPKPVAS